MGILDLFKGGNSMTKKVKKIEREMKIVVEEHFKHSFWIYRYGSFEIDSKNLVFWICVDSDIEKENLDSDPNLKGKLRKVLSDNKYPTEAIPYVHIGYESQETVDRTSNGNWYHHFK